MLYDRVPSLHAIGRVSNPNRVLPAATTDSDSASNARGSGAYAVGNRKVPHVSATSETTAAGRLRSQVDARSLRISIPTAMPPRKGAPSMTGGDHARIQNAPHSPTTIAPSGTLTR